MSIWGFHTVCDGFAMIFALAGGTIVKCRGHDYEIGYAGGRAAKRSFARRFPAPAGSGPEFQRMLEKFRNGDAVTFALLCSTRQRDPQLGVDPTVILVANSVRPLASGLRSEKPGFWRAAWLSTNR